MSDALDSQPEHIPPFPKTIVDDYEAVRADDDAPRPQREGLPRGYRMRADQHYVDQLKAPSAVSPVRMVLTADIDAEAPGQSDLRPLLESIRRLGIVHPLLVRRRGARYSIIAGRKRLTAAQVLRLSTVPCLVHDADDAQATVLAAADNLIVRIPEVNADRSGLVLGARQMVTHHLATVRACADLAADGNPWMVRSACDLIRAHGWRATRQASGPADGRQRSESAPLDAASDSVGSCVTTGAIGTPNGRPSCTRVWPRARAVYRDFSSVSNNVSS